MCFEWFIVAGIYNGLQIGIKLIPGDIYINGILLFAVMIASYIVYIGNSFFWKKKYNNLMFIMYCNIFNIINNIFR